MSEYKKSINDEVLLHFLFSFNAKKLTTYFYNLFILYLNEFISN